MSPGNAALIYNNVTFHFLHPKPEENDDFQPGKVIVRPGEMVLIIPGGCGPYEITGRLNKSWFDGKNADEGNEVDAYWSDVGVGWVGIWREVDHQYLFSFVLNPATAISVPDDE